MAGMVDPYAGRHPSRAVGFAECAGLPKISKAAVGLGLDEDEGARLARVAWEEIYPEPPPEYRSSECRPGGN
jgi:hypothetical protein